MNAFQFLVLTSAAVASKNRGHSRVSGGSPGLVAFTLVVVVLSLMLAVASICETLSTW